MRPDPVIADINEIKVPSAVIFRMAGVIERRTQRRPAVAAVAEDPNSSDGLNLSVGVDTPYDVVRVVAKHQVPVRISCDSRQAAQCYVLCRHSRRDITARKSIDRDLAVCAEIAVANKAERVAIWRTFDQVKL